MSRAPCKHGHIDGVMHIPCKDCRIEYLEGELASVRATTPSAPKPEQELPAWSVGEFYSSPSPTQKVLCLSVGDAIERDEKHGSFIRWIADSALLASQPAAPETYYCWLVELFLGDGGGNSLGFYHTGFTGIGGNSRTTQNVYEAKRYTKDKAEKVAASLDSMRGTWKAVEHGFDLAAPIAVQDDAVRDAAATSSDWNPMEVGGLLNRAANYIRERYAPTDHQWETAERMDTIANVFYSSGLAKRNHATKPSAASVEAAAAGASESVDTPELQGLTAEYFALEDYTPEHRCKLWEKVIAHIHAWHEAGVSAAVSPYQQAECERIEAIMAAREAKAAQGQDGAVYCTPTEHEGRIVYEHMPEPIPMSDWFVLYTRPPVLALTDEQINLIRCSAPFAQSTDHDIVTGTKGQLLYYARAILKAAQGEKP